MKSIDIVIPAYNEEDCVEELARRLKLLFDKESSYKWRALIVENGSTDNTMQLLEKIASDDARFSILSQLPYGRRTNCRT